MGRIAIALGAWLLSAFAARAEASSTDRLIIDVITASGTGCPGNVNIEVHPDQAGFDIHYSSLTAMVGVGASPVDFRKICQLTLLVHVPAGFNLDIDRAELRGFTSLATGATGQVRSSFAVASISPLTFVAQSFSGPFDEDWMFSEVIDHTAVVLPCRSQPGKLVLTTEVRVAAGTSDPTTTTSLIAVEGFGLGGASYRVSFPFCS